MSRSRVPDPAERAPTSATAVDVLSRLRFYGSCLLNGDDAVAREGFLVALTELSAAFPALCIAVPRTADPADRGLVDAWVSHAHATLARLPRPLRRCR